MEQYSQFEGRIKKALDRISISIEHSKSVQANSTGMDQDVSDKIAELTAANKRLETQLQQASDSQEANEISELRAKLEKLELDRQEETKEMQRLYDLLAIALNEGNATIGEDA